MEKASSYDAVNAAWPEQVPVPTPQEALSGAKRLFRKFRGKAWHGDWKITSGNRHTWPRRGVYQVNPNASHHDGGWKAMVHSMSHYISYRLYPEARAHGFAHAALEKEMAEYVVSRGWLEGKLRRPEKERAVISLSDIRLKRTLEAISRWETKAKRAKTALRKLYRTKAYYEKKAA